jgi:hypothetical protein
MARCKKTNDTAHRPAHCSPGGRVDGPQRQIVYRTREGFDRGVLEEFTALAKELNLI